MAFVLALEPRAHSPELLPVAELRHPSKKKGSPDATRCRVGLKPCWLLVSSSKIRAVLRGVRSHPECPGRVIRGEMGDSHGDVRLDRFQDSPSHATSNSAYRQLRRRLRNPARSLRTSAGVKTRIHGRGARPHRCGFGKIPAASRRWYWVSEIRSFRQMSPVSSSPSARTAA